jgi:endonuclease YncB( thermonuclease family)
MRGLAAPERHEPGGAEATAVMRRLIGNKEVRCELTGEQTHQRAAGYCRAGGVDLNGAMIRGARALTDIILYGCRSLAIIPETNRAAIWVAARIVR